MIIDNQTPYLIHLVSSRNVVHASVKMQRRALTALSLSLSLSLSPGYACLRGLAGLPWRGVQTGGGEEQRRGRTRETAATEVACCSCFSPPCLPRQVYIYAWCVFVEAGRSCLHPRCWAAAPRHAAASAGLGGVLLRQLLWCSGIGDDENTQKAYPL